MQVDVAGDEVVAIGRLVHVPEEWQRARARARRPPDPGQAGARCGVRDRRAGRARGGGAALDARALRPAGDDRRERDRLGDDCLPAVANHWPRDRDGLHHRGAGRGAGVDRDRGLAVDGTAGGAAVRIDRRRRRVGRAAPAASTRSPGGCRCGRPASAALLLTAGAGAAVESLTPRTLPALARLRASKRRGSRRWPPRSTAPACC